MTGEMSRDEVTREAYPIHFTVADKHNGTVEPFDQYQGPFVRIPARGRFWLCSDDGYECYWYDDNRDKRSDGFPYDDEPSALEAFDELL